MSHQSLIWVLYSIRNDSITPTEKLVLSRIKECFSLKINPKQWEKILNMLRNQKFSTIGEVDSPKHFSNKLPKNKFSIPRVNIVRMKDPLIGNETNALFLRNQEWIAEDTCVVQEGDESWRTFLLFLETYFSGSSGAETNGNSTSSSAGAYDRSGSESKMRPSAENKEKVGDLNHEVRSIPGGRYGCAQFIKACGGPELQKLSLGRLNLFVQEAINKGIIRYHRTLLIKNTNKEEDNDTDGGYSNTEGHTKGDSDSIDRGHASKNSTDKNMPHLSKEAKIKALQKALIELLKEYPSGVSLAQIPQNLKKKVPFSFTIQDLGFPKLKNFLNSIQDKIDIPMAGTNNSYAILKQPNSEEDKPTVLPAPSNPNIQATAVDPTQNKSSIRGHPSKSHNQSTHNFHQQYPQAIYQQIPAKSVSPNPGGPFHHNNMNGFLSTQIKTSGGHLPQQQQPEGTQPINMINNSSPHLSSYSKRLPPSSGYRKESDNG